MLAVIDETTPFVGSGICYCVVSGILLGDEIEARRSLRGVIPSERRRPFHWHEEGVTAKSAMLAALGGIGVVARAVVVPCGRRRQEAARRVAMRSTVGHLLDDGCDQLVIESRTAAQDGRDQALILDLLRARDITKKPTYAWDRKTNELLWIADAIGGPLHEHLLGVQTGWLEKLIASTGLTVEYRCLPGG